MASVHIANYVDMTYMFNISAGVGRNRPNRRMDVMLVQYLLNIATNVSVQGPVTSMIPIRPPDHPEDLKTDGICGENTRKFIDHYQAFRSANANFSAGNKLPINMVVKADGAIDPWRYPVALNVTLTAYMGKPLTPTLTLVTRCYDAAKSSDFSSGSFRLMQHELRIHLCAH